MKQRNEIGLIILAAGASVRLGTPKQLLNFRGETLLRRIARESLESVCRPIVVVFGHEPDKFKNELKNLDVWIVENSGWKAGMGSSLKVGLKKLLDINKSLHGAVITVCDQPFVTALTINELVETHQKSEAFIVASEYRQTLGVPALFDRKIFIYLQNIENSGGAKQIINQFPAKTISFSFPDGAIDVDTPDDYARLSSQF